MRFYVHSSDGRFIAETDDYSFAVRMAEAATTSADLDFPDAIVRDRLHRRVAQKFERLMHNPLEEHWVSISDELGNGLRREKVLAIDTNAAMAIGVSIVWAMGGWVSDVRATTPHHIQITAVMQGVAPRPKPRPRSRW